MGHYTEFRFTGHLKAEMPAVEIDLLKTVIIKCVWELDESGEIKRPAITHKFFDCPRWLSLLTDKDFDEDKFSRLTVNPEGGWVLDIYSSFKNYDHEIDYFLDWIAPYLLCTKEREYIGWHQHEFDDGKTIIYFLHKEQAFVHDQTPE